MILQSKEEIKMKYNKEQIYDVFTNLAIRIKSSKDIEELRSIALNLLDGDYRMILNLKRRIK